MTLDDSEKITIPGLEWYNDRTLSSEEKWERAGLENNFIFYRVMTENPELCKEVIELLLEMEIEHIEIKTESTLQIDPYSKGIRMDVYAKSDGKMFNLEMQTTNTGELPERARYYQAVLDVDNLKQGNLYKSLPDSYVIFICLNDIFKKGLPVYTFENFCEQKPDLRLNDRTKKYFFCVPNCDKLLNEKQKTFLNLLAKKSESKDAFTAKLISEVNSAKQSAQAKVAFMEWDRIKAYAEDAGFKRGEISGQKKAKLETAVIAVKEFNIPVETVSEKYGVDLEELKQALNK